MQHHPVQYEVGVVRLRWVVALLATMAGCQSSNPPRGTAAVAFPSSAVTTSIAGKSSTSPSVTIPPVVSSEGVIQVAGLSADQLEDDNLPPPAKPPAESLPGSPASGLALADVIELASANNPTLIQARAQVNGTLGKALQAGLWPNPTLGYQAEKIGSMGTAGEFQGAFVQQEIVTAQKRRISREKYLARAQAAEFVALAQQYRVINDIRRQYWRAVGAEQLVKIHEQMVKNANDRLVTTDELHNVGQANSVQVRQARVGRQRTQLSLQSAQNESAQARRELEALVGMELPAEPLAEYLDDELPPLEWCSSLAYTLSESPELREAGAKLQGDRITVERELRQPVPNVFVRGGPGYDFTEDRTVYNAQVYLQVPIWNRNQGTIQQAQADLNRQQAEIRRIELRLERDLAMHYRKYQTALQHRTAYREEVLPEIEEAYRERLKAYEERRETWPNVLDVQSELYQRQMEFVQNLVAWRESQTLIDGFLLTGGLDAPPNPTPPGHIDATQQPR